MQHLAALTLVIASALVALANQGNAQTPVPAPSGVTIQVVVDASAQARVVERYRLPGDTGTIQLQLLQRRCAEVGSVTLVRATDTVGLARSSKGPWISLRDTTDVSGSLNAEPPGFEVRYSVALRGAAADIPLVHVPRQIPRAEGEREGRVALSVVTDGEVTFPRLSRPRPGEPWTGHFVAVPSFIRVARPTAQTATAPCADTTPADLDDGGLTWRFWTLLGIMVAWVPIYLAWARRAEIGGDG